MLTYERESAMSAILTYERERGTGNGRPETEK